MGTKYRDIADGNAYWKPFSGSNFWLGTKYRDIADGNSFLHRSRLIVHTQLGTKYRDIADGNCFTEVYTLAFQCDVGNQVPRYSGWKPIRQLSPHITLKTLGTKYRDIADGNLQ